MVIFLKIPCNFQENFVYLPKFKDKIQKQKGMKEKKYKLPEDKDAAFVGDYHCQRGGGLSSDRSHRSRH